MKVPAQWVGIMLTLIASHAAAQTASQLSALKGKMKPGLYAQRMEMDMGSVPGMPPGMGKQSFTLQNCLTDDDIEKGELGRKDKDKDAPDCKVSDFKVSATSAAYRMVCKGETPMTADVVIAFVSDGFRMNMKSTMDMGGQKMTSSMAIDAKYLGPCKK